MAIGPILDKAGAVVAPAHLMAKLRVPASSIPPMPCDPTRPWGSYRGRAGMFPSALHGAEPSH